MTNELTPEALLAELCQMFPGRGIFIDMDLWDHVKTEDGSDTTGSHAWVSISSNEEGVPDADFAGHSLAEVLDLIKRKRGDVAL